MKLLRFEPLHDLANILSAVARANQKRVWSFDNYQIAHANRSHKFLWTPQEIATGIESKMRAGGNIIRAGFIAVSAFRACGNQFVHGLPGADIAPADFSWNHVDYGFGAAAGVAGSRIA